MVWDTWVWNMWRYMYYMYVGMGHVHGCGTCGSRYDMGMRHVEVHVRGYRTGYTEASDIK